VDPFQYAGSEIRLHPNVSIPRSLRAKRIFAGSLVLTRMAKAALRAPGMVRHPTAMTCGQSSNDIMRRLGRLTAEDVAGGGLIGGGVLRARRGARTARLGGLRGESGMDRTPRMPNTLKRKGGVRNKMSRSVAACGVFLIAVLPACQAAEVVLIRGALPRPAEESQIRDVSEYLGLTFETVNAGTRGRKSGHLPSLESPSTLAVLIAQDALANLDREQIRSALPGTRGHGIPILIFGYTGSEDGHGLRSWSHGAVQGCASMTSSFQPSVLDVGNAQALTGSLDGLELPAVAAPACATQLAPDRKAQTVLAARGNGEAGAVLVRVQTKAGDVFFTPQMRPFDDSWIGQPSGLAKAFSSMAPFLLFLRYAAGDYAWHPDAHYANLTIDDVWLRQPYGHLSFPALLTEMEKHNFHTTLAFIPWNFDRSEPEVVRLLHAYPARFSICVHGNDHVHREFGEYSRAPLQRQIADIKQGLARMERFRTLTGLPYDRFMVFPHAVAPEPTFAALKEYGFLGTANSGNVPLGVPFPSDPAFLLRTYTDAYANLLSLSRYSVQGNFPRVEIAIHSFLGNPLLFSGHEDLFANGIGSFDKIADLVNRLNPDTHWAGLGEIARRLHLVRLRQDGGMDVRMLTNEARLVNPTDRDAIFHVRTLEGCSPAPLSFTVDGARAAYECSGGSLELTLTIPARATRTLRAVYQAVDLSHQQVAKTDLRAQVLRRISDFRDLYLSTSFWGLAIKRAYYSHQIDSVELYVERYWWVCAACAGLLAAGMWYRRRKVIARTAVSQRALRPRGTVNYS
jgi:peptidoglycan/xylan/chitin deacetylase (PgdA/CDA1 family)